MEPGKFDPSYSSERVMLNSGTVEKGIPDFLMPFHGTFAVLLQTGIVTHYNTPILIPHSKLL